MSEEDGGISQFSHLSYIEKNGEVNGLLSNQILQRTINEIGDIIECNCSIWNTDGVMLAAVGKEKPAVKKAVCSFLKELEVTGVSEEHLDECYGLFRSAACAGISYNPPDQPSVCRRDPIMDCWTKTRNFREMISFQMYSLHASMMENWRSASIRFNHPMPFRKSFIARIT